MKFYQDATTEEWKLGRLTIPAGSCIKDVNETTGIVRIEAISSGRTFAELKSTEFQKENGDAYADLAEFETATQGFFFRVSGSGSVSSDGFLYLPTSVSSKGIRIGERAGFVYAIDRALTATGFTGTEGVDWENLGGQESV